MRCDEGVRTAPGPSDYLLACWSLLLGNATATAAAAVSAEPLIMIFRRSGSWVKNNNG